MKLAPFIASVSACAWLLASAPDTTSPISESRDTLRIMASYAQLNQKESFQLSDSTRTKQQIHLETNESVGTFPYPTDSQ